MLSVINFAIQSIYIRQEYTVVSSKNIEWYIYNIILIVMPPKQKPEMPSRTGKSSILKPPDFIALEKSKIVVWITANVIFFMLSAVQLAIAP